MKPLMSRSLRYEKLRLRNLDSEKFQTETVYLIFLNRTVTMGNRS